GLSTQKLRFYDPGHYNGGTLPEVTNIIKQSYAVSIDPPAVQDLSAAVTPGKRWLGRTFTPAAAPAGAGAPGHPPALHTPPAKGNLQSCLAARKRRARCRPYPQILGQGAGDEGFRPAQGQLADSRHGVP